MFLEPVRAASYRGHHDIVKLILADDTNKITKDKLTSQTLIVNFFNDHKELLDLTLGTDWHHCAAEPENTHNLQDLASKFTRNPEIFKRLLKKAKPHIRRYTKDQDTSFGSKNYSWYESRVYCAAESGKTKLLKYLIEEERAEIINEDAFDDDPLFCSRHPVEFITGYMARGRARTILSIVAKRGDADAVQFLLKAGFKNDRAIAFAAMSGSRTIARQLWENGRHQDEAVQEALAIAVDGEDTAIFNLLIELGAKLDDDVRAAITEKAQDEGLESMVGLLASS